MYIGYLGFLSRHLMFVGGEIANIPMELRAGVWDCAMSGVYIGKASGQEVWGQRPQKLKALSLRSKFLYFQGCTVKIQHLEVTFMVLARAYRCS